MPDHTPHTGAVIVLQKGDREHDLLKGDRLVWDSPDRTALPNRLILFTPRRQLHIFGPVVLVGTYARACPFCGMAIDPAADPVHDTYACAMRHPCARRQPRDLAPRGAVSGAPAACSD